MQPTVMNPKELSYNDDIATSLIFDPYLGFTSHKMNLKFNSYQIHNVALKAIIKDFMCDQNYHKALKRILKGVWMPRIKSTEKHNLEQHVCIYMNYYQLYISCFHANFNV